MGITESGLNRRDLLRKGAAAGVVVWTAPIVLSSPAFAATGKCSGSKPCVDFFFFQSTGGTDCSGTDASCTYPTILDCNEDAVAPQDPCDGGDPTRPTVSITGGGTEDDDKEGCITYPAGYVPIFFNAKLGSNCYIVHVNDDFTLTAPTPTPPACNDVEFTITGSLGTGFQICVTVGDTSNCGDAGGHGVSHVATAYCK